MIIEVKWLINHGIDLTSYFPTLVYYSLNSLSWFMQPKNSSFVIKTTFSFLTPQNDICDAECRC